MIGLLESLKVGVRGNPKVGVGMIYLLALLYWILQQEILLRIYHAKVGVGKMFDPSNRTKEL